MDLQQPSRPFSDVSNRIAMIERKLDSITEHLNMLDSNIIDKHKAALDKIKQLEQSLSSMKSEVDQASKMTLRIEKRLESFATRDQLEVLEKYVSFFQPLKFVTEEEVKRFISDALQEGIKSKRK